jgi:hypothetical protein
VVQAPVISVRFQESGDKEVVQTPVISGRFQESGDKEVVQTLVISRRFQELGDREGGDTKHLEFLYREDSFSAIEQPITSLITTLYSIKSKKPENPSLNKLGIYSLSSHYKCLSLVLLSVGYYS